MRLWIFFKIRKYTLYLIELITLYWHYHLYHTYKLWNIGKYTTNEEDYEAIIYIVAETKMIFPSFLCHNTHSSDYRLPFLNVILHIIKFFIHSLSLEWDKCKYYKLTFMEFLSIFYNCSSNKTLYYSHKKAVLRNQHNLFILHTIKYSYW